MAAEQLQLTSKILIVDDEILNINLLEKYLKQAGYKNISARVSLKTAQKSTWWLGPGNLCVMLQQDANQNGKIAKIVVGESGKGYGDKTKWQAQQKKNVSVHRLPK